MLRNSLNKKLIDNIEKRLGISKMLLNKGYLNECIIIAWIAIRETIFLKLEEFNISFQSTTEAIFNFIEHQNNELINKNIILLYHLGIMSEWDRNFKIDKKEAVDIYEKTNQIYKHIIKK